MRIAIALDDEHEGTDVAEQADAAGIAAVQVPWLGGGEAAFAAAVAAVTRDVRILVPVALGSDNPTTLAEELSVVDQISAGRVVAVLDSSGVDEAQRDEDTAVLAAAWSGRWVDLPARWRGERAVRVAVTPAPAQLVLPMWTTVVDADASVEQLRTADAVRAVATGHLDADRAEIVRLAEAGVAVAVLSAHRDLALERYVARYLVPEATMPFFPRIIADSAWPAPAPPS